MCTLKTDKHLLLYNKMINKWAGLYFRKNLGEFEDMLQECYMVYLKACDTYDENRGAFSTHLTTLLRNTMYYKLRQINREPIILSLDVQKSDAHDSFLNLVENHYFELDGFVGLIYKGYTVSEIHRELGISRRKVYKQLEKERKNIAGLDFIK